MKNSNNGNNNVVWGRFESRRHINTYNRAYEEFELMKEWVLAQERTVEFAESHSLDLFEISESYIEEEEDKDKTGK